jgi:beta-lactamase class A
MLLTRRAAVPATLALALTIAGCARRGAEPNPSVRPSPRELDASAAIAARVARTPDAVARVVAYRLDGRGPRIAILGDSLVHAASTMKVPVLIALAQRADRGLLRLDEAMLLENRFTSIVDQSTYTLDRADDSDDAVYARVGERVPIRWLATRMITHSSNLATNAMLTVVRADSVTAMTRTLGTTRMLVRRGVEDTPAFRAGLNNVTTASDLARLMEAIATDRAASPASCAWMRDVLFAQFYNTAIPMGLPAGVRIAHKTGDITRVEHDAAIVYPERGAAYVLVVLTSGVESQAAARTLIADITRIVHAAMQRG